MGYNSGQAQAHSLVGSKAEWRVLGPGTEAIWGGGLFLSRFEEEAGTQVV